MRSQDRPLTGPSCCPSGLPGLNPHRAGSHWGGPWRRLGEPSPPLDSLDTGQNWKTQILARVHEIIIFRFSPNQKTT